MNRIVKMAVRVGVGVLVATTAITAGAVLWYRPTLEYVYVDPNGAYWFMLALVALLATGSALVVLRFARAGKSGQMK